jgi:hypothetical protein
MKQAFIQGSLFPDYPEYTVTEGPRKSDLSRESCSLVSGSVSFDDGPAKNITSSTQVLIQNASSLLGTTFGADNVCIAIKHKAACCNPQSDIRQHYSSEEGLSCDCSASLEITLNLENSEVSQSFYTTVEQLEKLAPLISDLVIASAVEKFTRMYPECLVPMGGILQQLLAESSPELVLQMEVNPRMMGTPDHMRRLGITQ